MNSLQSWSDTLASSFQLVWDKIIVFLPELIAALVVIIVGFIIANGLGVLTEKIVNALKIDALLEGMGLNRILSRTNLRLKAGKLLSGIVYWLLVIAFLIAAADILHLKAVSDFLTQVLLYLPNIVVAILILVATFYFANFMKELVKHSTKAAKMREANLLASVTWWIIVIFGFLSALLQLKIAINIINIFVAGAIGMLALAGGLAFGLGGKDYAKDLLERFRKDLE